MYNFTNLTIIYDGYAYEEEDQQDIIDDAYSTFEITRLAISIIIILLNSTLLCCYCRKDLHIQKSASKQILFSLTICDLLIGTCVAFQAISFYWKHVRHLEVRLTLDVYQLFLTKVNVLHLCGLPLERYISLFYALEYKSVVTKRSVAVYVALSWLIPFILSVIRFSWLLKMHDDIHEEYIDGQIELWYSMGLFIIFLAIPMFLLGVAYLRMFYEIRRIMMTRPGTQRAVKCLSKQLRVLSIFALMYVAFLLVAMPFFSLRFWIDICNWKGYFFRISFKALQVIIIMKNVTSILNPIFYTIITPEVRSALTRRIARSNNRTMLATFFLPREIEQQQQQQQVKGTTTETNV